MIYLLTIVIGLMLSKSIGSNTITYISYHPHHYNESRMINIIIYVQQIDISSSDAMNNRPVALVVVVNLGQELTQGRFIIYGQRGGRDFVRATGKI